MKYICSLVIFSICVSSSEPIAYLNTLGYEVAQKETARGNNGMVTTQHFLATGVGEKILNKGGNAYVKANTIKTCCGVCAEDDGGNCQNRDGNRLHARCKAGDHHSRWPGLAILGDFADWRAPGGKFGNEADGGAPPRTNQNGEPNT